jgi:prepilin-type N-terminal cleavage/methylation domain-containing protein
MRKEINEENGFTLVETLIALFIGSFMMIAIYVAINTAQNTSSKIERRVTAQQDARGALELMAMEIRMASYNPTLSNNIWVTPPDSCSGSSSHLDYMGIQEAGANSISIEMDINGNGVINSTTSNPNEIIRYVYDSTNKYITRSTNCGGNQPFLGASAANADTKTVLVENNAANVPVFRYYDGNNNELTAPVATPGNIRRIEVTLVADTYYSEPGSTGRKRIIYSTSVIPRNHLITFQQAR